MEAGRASAGKGKGKDAEKKMALKLGCDSSKLVREHEGTGWGSVVSKVQEGAMTWHAERDTPSKKDPGCGSEGGEVTSKRWQSSPQALPQSPQVKSCGQCVL
jgi:hypothetical protein